MDSISADTPISTENDDTVGYNDYAKTIARVIANDKDKSGWVLAINGPWGSGKSSLLNLIKLHLGELNSKQPKKRKIINFNCWWFRGHEALTLAFFLEIYAALDENMAAKNALKKLGSQILSVSASSIGAATNLVLPLGGGFASSAVKKFANFIDRDQSVEDIFKTLNRELENLDQPLVVFIDDIDRLAPEESLQIF